MTKEIKLTKNKVALIDDEDFEFLNQFKWYFNTGYAMRRNKKQTILMHRVINNTPDGMETDHINRKKLDNRRINLRSCTNQQNQMNSSKMINTTSKYKGVCWHINNKKWQVNIQNKYLGYFKSELEAAKAYDKAAKELFGEFARLNAGDG